MRYPALARFSLTNDNSSPRSLPAEPVAQDWGPGPLETRRSTGIPSSMRFPGGGSWPTTNPIPYSSLSWNRTMPTRSFARRRVRSASSTERPIRVGTGTRFWDRGNLHHRGQPHDTRGGAQALGSRAETAPQGPWLPAGGAAASMPNGRVACAPATAGPRDRSGCGSRPRWPGSSRPRAVPARPGCGPRPRRSRRKGR
jgi:hypothetical protein